ncbi:MAG: sugar porter family MFS transporter [Bacteroidota bacterium]
MNKQGNIILIALIVAIGGFLMGFDASVISGVNKYIKLEFNLTDLQVGWAVSSLTFVAMLAMLVAGPLSDRFGRKPILSVAAVLFAISAIFSAFAPSYTLLVVARMIGGLGVGASLIIAPMYIAEISPAKVRGQMVSFNQLNIVIGISAAYFSNYFILQLADSQADWASSLGINEDYAWRWMLGLESIPAVIYFFALFLVPNSPRWLMLQARFEEALKVLRRIAGPENGEKEFYTIKENLETPDENKKAPIGDLFKSALRLVLLIGIVVAILQQITGINSVFFYAPMIFEQSGIGEDASFTQAIYVGLVNLVFTVIAMSLIDRLGRKPLLAGGMIGITAFMFMLAYGFNSATYTLPKDAFGVAIGPLEEIINQPFEDEENYTQALSEALGDEFPIFEEALFASTQITSSLKLDSVATANATFDLALISPLLSKAYANDSLLKAAMQEVMGDQYSLNSDFLEQSIVQTYVLSQDDLASLPSGILPRGVQLSAIQPLVGQTFDGKGSYKEALKDALGYHFFVLEGELMKNTSTTFLLKQEAINRFPDDVKRSLTDVVDQTYTREKTYLKALKGALDTQFEALEADIMQATTATYTLEESELGKLPLYVDYSSFKPLVDTTFENDVAFKNALKSAYAVGLEDVMKQKYQMVEKRLLTLAGSGYTLAKDSLESLPDFYTLSTSRKLVGKKFASEEELKNAIAAAFDQEESLKKAAVAAYTENETSLISSAITMDPMLILIGILGFVASFAISAGPVMWVLFSELFPNYIRGFAISFVGVINSLISFLVQLVFPWELANLGNATTFLIYGLFAAAGFGFVAWVVPETKGKSLEELEEILIQSEDTPSRTYR